MHDCIKASGSVPRVQSCSLDVIVRNYTRFKDFESDHNLKRYLSKCCKDFLIYNMLSEKTTINLLDNKLARIYSIAYVIVQRIAIQNNSSKGVVSRSTKISIKSVHSEDYYRFSKEASSACKLGGLDNEIKKILQLVRLNQMNTNLVHRPLGVVIHGPPGCGKTSFVKRLAIEGGAVLFRVDTFDLLKSDYGAGATSLRSLFQRAIELIAEGPVILFFDEIDVLCPHPEKASMGNKQLSNALMVEVDELQRNNIAGLLVVSTTNAISSIDHLLRRPGRFDQELLINVPNQEQRFSILEVLTSDLLLGSDVCLNNMAQRTPGFVGADLQQMCEEAFNQAISNQADKTESVVLKLCDFEFALHKVIPSLKKSSECIIDLQPVLWEDIGGLEDVKAEMKQSVEWPLMFPEALSAMDISPTKGILLYGPPGCCKTTLVKAAATSSNVSFLSLNGAQVYSPYVGESERIISEAFQKARALSPAILFFDEMESLVGKRTSGSGQSRIQERILSTLLNEMDGVGTRLDRQMHRLSVQDNGDQKTLGLDTVSTDHYMEEEGKEKIGSSCPMGVMLVGATNRPDMLDAAILRPGRLDRHIYVPPPDLQARKSILKIFTTKISSDEDLDLDILSQQTHLYTGADLKNLCKEAGLVALREHTISTSSLKVTQRHFVQALKMVKASLSEETLKQYQEKKI